MVSKLNALSVSTAEELVSLYLNDASSLGKYLECPDRQLRRIVDLVCERLDPDTLKDLYSEPVRHPTGARSPYGEEFAKYFSKRRTHQ
jgi:hypothetical protein